MSSFRRSAVVGLVFVASFATTAHAFDPTGTWTGTQSCVADATTGKTKTKAEVSFTISGDGGGYVGSITQDEGSTPVLGSLLPSATDPNKGLMSLTVCPPFVTVSATGRLKVKTDPSDGSGKIKGAFLVAAPGVVGTCKISVARVSTADPGVTIPCVP